MTEAELSAIEKACAEASAGPWTATEWQMRDKAETRLAELEGPAFTGYEQNLRPPDARFIAGARQWVPDLVAEVRRLRADVHGPGPIGGEAAKAFYERGARDERWRVARTLQGMACEAEACGHKRCAALEEAAKAISALKG